MDATEVDERDSTWENHHPRFRVYVQEPSGETYTTATYDLTGADVLQAMDWAQRQAATRSDAVWALALVGQDSRGLRGLTWLVGMDANDPPSDDHEIDLRLRMTSRTARPVGVPSRDQWRPEGSSAAVVHANPWFTVTETVDASERSWFRLRSSDSVIVAAMVDDRIVFVHGVRDTTGPEPRYELPSGGIEPSDDSAAAAAARELLEETGAVCGELTEVGTFVAEPGVSDVRTRVFVGTVTERRETALEPGEDWTTVELEPSEVDAAVSAGEVTDGATLAALLLLRRP
ncbi:8-oxo-dGTP pyrophosphatase MutT (NUDIX family) [Curtobacterium sp. PhB130]|uniref:NUDIX hydrolase n=1 Tax=unclassified Curtobacterium TaxID=257496 RepID=UPI000FAC1C4E|nr:MULTISPECIES: NUDIX hydrolase [unclassified Curtobacterium]ROP63541.1 8-oxo-dGTP pyrophosphatase MutT (NUDIX family) [Curtobacterium sp. ZW137]ROS77802.1 8-oxo-dGTP pyrophosphatase MutT (NUDIX family) [Curtobacterium sp. PhB130]